MKNTPHSNRRTSSHLKNLGFEVHTVQEYIHAIGKRRDLFHIIDVLTMRPDIGIVGIQATTKTHLADHRRDLIAKAASRIWLASGGRLQLWCWRKVGAKGGARKWAPRIEEARLANGVVSFVLLKNVSAFNEENDGVEGLAAAA